MPQTVKEQVNLAVCPAVSDRVGIDSEIVIGDVHANALKLLFFLVREGVLKINPDQYNQISAIYQKPVSELTESDIHTFNQIITSAEVNPVSPKIVIIGDELFDRGSNDYFVLKILDHINSNNVRFDVIASNHGFEFLQAYERGLSDTNSRYLGQTQHFGRSFANLHQLITRMPNLKQSTQKMVEASYKNNLKLLSYTLDKENNAIQIHTHAPVGMPTLQALAKKMNVPFNANSPIELAQTIDAMNLQLAQLLKEGKANQIFPTQLDMRDPVCRLIWNRYADSNEFNLPNGQYNGFNVSFVHGHDNDGVVPASCAKYVTNLDNHLGKDTPMAPSMTGEYTISRTSHPHRLIAENHFKNIQVPLHDVLVDAYIQALSLNVDMEWYTKQAEGLSLTLSSEEFENVSTKLHAFVAVKALLDQEFKATPVNVSQLKSSINTVVLALQEIERLPSFEGKAAILSDLNNYVVALNNSRAQIDSVINQIEMRQKEQASYDRLVKFAQAKFATAPETVRGPLVDTYINFLQMQINGEVCAQIRADSTIPSGSHEYTAILENLNSILETKSDMSEKFDEVDENIEVFIGSLESEVISLKRDLDGIKRSSAAITVPDSHPLWVLVERDTKIAKTMKDNLQQCINHLSQGLSSELDICLKRANALNEELSGFRNPEEDYARHYNILSNARNQIKERLEAIGADEGENQRKLDALSDVLNNMARQMGIEVEDDYNFDDDDLDDAAPDDDQDDLLDDVDFDQMASELQQEFNKSAESARSTAGTSEEILKQAAEATRQSAVSAASIAADQAHQRDSSVTSKSSEQVSSSFTEIEASASSLEKAVMELYRADSNSASYSNSYKSIKEAYFKLLNKIDNLPSSSSQAESQAKTDIENTLFTVSRIMNDLPAPVVSQVDEQKPAGPSSTFKP